MANENIFAIGAVGGSGTRVVADIFIALGIFMGNDLNTSLDNLFFTRLFKDPNWFNKASNKDFEKRFTIFSKYMTNSRLNLCDILEIYRAKNSKMDKIYHFDLIKMLFPSKNQKPLVWGWKEPNTQIYIEQIASFFPTLRYVHVIRYGLDMAFSQNRQQLYNWGYLFNLSSTQATNDEELIKMQLDYWIQSNKHSISIGEKLLGERFYLLNYNNLCLYPSVELPKLIEFLGYNPDNKLMQKLIEIPKNQLSTGRYKYKDISIFSKEQIREVVDLGFDVSV